MDQSGSHLWFIQVDHTNTESFWFKQNCIQSKEIYNAMNVRSSTSLKTYITMIARNKTIYFRKYTDKADACDSKTNSTYQLKKQDKHYTKVRRLKQS